MDAISSQVIVDLFTNTPFVGFLIWQYVQMRRDYKEQQDKMDVLRNESLQREEQVRLRFEKVISTLQEDKDQLVQGVDKRLSSVESQIKKLFGMITKLQNQIAGSKNPIRKNKPRNEDSDITISETR
jgi:predicted nuclease with TOPRIM domain